MNSKVVALAVVVILIAAGAGIVVYNGLKHDTDKTIDVNLEIFGNADKDDRISENDAVMIEKYIAAVEAGDSEAISEIDISTTFADANLDGSINTEDAAQVRAIVAGTADNIWMLDGVGNERKISTDISRIGCEYFSNTELCLILGQADKIVAVDNAPYLYSDFYFTESQQSNITNMFNCNKPDYDLINTLNLDTYLLFSGSASYEAKQEKIIDCDVIYLGLYNPDLTNTEKSSFVQGVLKAGYIFGAVDRAEDYINWLIDYRDEMLDIADSIDDSDKPVVCMSNYTSGQYFMDDDSNLISVYRTNDPLGQAVTLAGGTNVIELLSDSSFVTSGSYAVKVQIDSIFNDDESVEVNYFFLHMVKYTYGATVNSGVPDHGYLTTDDSEMAAAYAIATDHSLITDEKISLIAGDFRNGCTGGVLLAAYMGSVINAEAYSDIDPIAMHNEYVKWLGIEDYDVSEDGLLIYPSV